MILKLPILHTDLYLLLNSKLYCVGLLLKYAIVISQEPPSSSDPKQPGGAWSQEPSRISFGKFNSVMANWHSFLSRGIVFAPSQPWFSPKRMYLSIWVQNYIVTSNINFLSNIINIASLSVIQKLNLPFSVAVVVVAKVVVVSIMQFTS